MFTQRRVELKIKRLFDVVACSALFVVTFPLLVILGVLVKLSSPGPVFFAQERAGQNQKIFRILKLRTMTLESNKKDTLRMTSADVSRITKIGAILRDYGLDELPQILNIIRGDMSIIGPRPPLVHQARHYTAWQQQVFKMRPGVLSLPAIRGRRTLSPEQRIELNIEYVNNWSLWIDITILWKSLFVVLKRQGATELFIESESND